MAFISEIVYSGTGEESGEYLEVAIAKSENPADFTVSFYGANGSLHTGTKDASSFFPGQNEITLKQVFDAIGTIPGEVANSISGGVSLAINEDPDNSNYYIVRIPSPLTADSAPSVEGVALTNTVTNTVLDAYDVGGGTTIRGTFDDGVAAGADPVATGNAGSGRGVQIDYLGNVTTSPVTLGDAVVPDPVCFTTGCMIETDEGEVAVENLEIGDHVRTYDRGYQPIRFIYKTMLTPFGSIRPVRFKKGAIGNADEFMVSQQHRFLVSELPQRIKRHASIQDSLIKAIELVDGETVEIVDDTETVTYFHIMLDEHELLYCYGTVSESWQPHRRNLNRDKELSQELLTIFPEIRNKTAKPARPEVMSRPWREFKKAQLRQVPIKRAHFS